MGQLLKSKIEQLKKEKRRTKAANMRKIPVPPNASYQDLNGEAI